MNSLVTEWITRLLAAERAGRFIEYKPVYVAQFPIPAAPPTERRAIERLVRRLLALRGEGSEAAALEQELNERVYRLFELTNEEIALIEGSLGRQMAR
jgi:hypothetical protein